MSALEFRVVPRASLEGDGGHWVTALQDGRGAVARRDHAGVGHRDRRSVRVASVEHELHRRGAAGRLEVRGVAGCYGQHGQHRAPHQQTVYLRRGVQPLDHHEVPTRYEGVREFAALSRSVLVQDRDPNVVDVQADRVSEEQEEKERERKRQDHAARISRARRGWRGRRSVVTLRRLTAIAVRAVTRSR